MPPVSPQDGGTGTDSAARVRCVGRLVLSSALAADDLTLLAALTRHWRPDGAQALVPCGDVPPQVAAESLRRIQSMVLGPRGIRLRGSVLVVAGGDRFGTISVRHGKVTSHQLGGRRAPVQADPTVHIDLAMPRGEAAATQLSRPAAPAQTTTETSSPSVAPPARSSVSPDQNLPGS